MSRRWIIDPTRPPGPAKVFAIVVVLREFAKGGRS